MGSADYSLRLITEPASEPVSLAEAKAHLVVEHSSDDTLISTLITSARRHVEARTHRGLVRQQWRLTLDCFADAIDLRKYPVLSVASVNYIDGNGASQIVGGSVSPMNPQDYYTLDLGANCIRRAYGATWPTPRYQKSAVWVDFWAGYANDSVSPTTAVPADLRTAILLLIGDLYEHRERKAETELYHNDAFELLIGAYWVPE